MRGSKSPADAGAADPAAPGTRAIDYPLENLPEIDEHGTLIHAPPERVWEALLAVLPRSFSGRLTGRVAEKLGCAETELRGEPGTIGSTFPGFICARSVEPAMLALEGRHRFSRYALLFRLEPTKDNKTLLRAETRALFRGWKGRVYRTLVIRTRGHVLAVNSILRGVRKRAEREG